MLGKRRLSSSDTSLSTLVPPSVANEEPVRPVSPTAAACVDAQTAAGGGMSPLLSVLVTDCIQALPDLSLLVQRTEKLRQSFGALISHCLSKDSVSRSPTEEAVVDEVAGFVAKALVAYLGSADGSAPGARGGVLELAPGADCTDGGNVPVLLDQLLFMVPNVTELRLRGSVLTVANCLAIVFNRTEGVARHGNIQPWSLHLEVSEEGGPEAFGRLQIALQQWQQKSTLDLSGAYWTDERLVNLVVQAHLQGLQELVMKDCPAVALEQLSRICELLPTLCSVSAKNCKEVRSLDLHGQFWNDMRVEELVTKGNFGALEELRIHDCPLFEGALIGRTCARLPNLRCLVQRRLSPYFLPCLGPSVPWPHTPALIYPKLENLQVEISLAAFEETTRPPHPAQGLLTKVTLAKPLRLSLTLDMGAFSAEDAQVRRLLSFVDTWQLSQPGLQCELRLRNLALYEHRLSGLCSSACAFQSLLAGLLPRFELTQLDVKIQDCDTDLLEPLYHISRWQCRERSACGSATGSQGLQKLRITHLVGAWKLALMGAGAGTVFADETTGTLLDHANCRLPSSLARLFLPDSAHHATDTLKSIEWIIELGDLRLDAANIARYTQMLRALSALATHPACTFNVRLGAQGPLNPLTLSAAANNIFAPQPSPLPRAGGGANVPPAGLRF